MRQILATLVAVVPLVVPVSSSAQYAHDFIGGSDVYTVTLAVQQAPASQVELTKAYLANIQPMQNPAADDVANGMALAEGATTAECIVYTNRAPQPVKHIQVVFTYVSAGEVVLEEPLDSTYNVAPGATFGQFPINYTGTCRSSSAVIHGSTVWYYTAREDVTITAAVVEADFADGTSWHAGLSP